MATSGDDYFNNSNNNKHKLGCSNGRLAPFDDGHIPETFQDGNDTGRIVRDQLRCAGQCLEVFDNVLTENLVDAIYNMSASPPEEEGISLNTRNNNNNSSWGTYVTMNEALGCDRDDTVEHPNNNNTDNNNTNNNETKQKELATAAVSQFLIKKAAAAGLLQDDFSRIHGVAVWALAADVDSKVRYHIDYAELIRYEHNIIYPPLYAGTIQCTKTIVKGGDFRVNTDGLDHYEEYGYKGKKKKKKGADGTKKEDDSSWVTIPYRYNQGIIHNGDYPHESTPITFLTRNTKRVIMGFNMFGHDVGPLVQAAPEHSSAFNRRVKLYRAMTRVANNAAVHSKGSAFDGNDTQKKSKNIDMQVISKNKALRKLLVLAKREKVKSDLKKQQHQMTLGVFTALMEGEENPNKVTDDCGSTSYGSSSSLTVSQLIQRIVNDNHQNLVGRKEEEVSSSEYDGNLVRPVDVRVHINLMVRNAAKYGVQVVSAASCGHSEKDCLYDESGMILDTVRLRRTSKTDYCEGLE